MMNGTFEITMSQCHAHVISVGDIGYHSHAHARAHDDMCDFSRFAIATSAITQLGLVAYDSC